MTEMSGQSRYAFRMEAMAQPEQTCGIGTVIRITASNDGLNHATVTINGQPTAVAWAGPTWSAGQPLAADTNVATTDDGITIECAMPGHAYDPQPGTQAILVHAPTDQLPYTGSNVAVLAGIGLGAIVVGFTLGHLADRLARRRAR